jgi:ribosomal protein S18 acetylase RimI-like enzyme
MSRPSEASQLEIRLAEPGDEELIASLILAAFSPFKGDYTPDAFEYTAATADRISERFAEGPMWLAFDGDAAVGTVSGLPEQDRFYIRSMAVSPEAQGSGVGQKLLDVLEAHARDAGFEKLYLYTTYVLPGAKRLYEKNGFYVLRETLPEEWFGMGGLEMEKKLN